MVETLNTFQLGRVKSIRKRRNLTCGGECGHTQTEHDAFDLGIADGEYDAINKTNRDNPFGDFTLREAWATGYSVGFQTERAVKI